MKEKLDIFSHETLLKANPHTVNFEGLFVSHSV